MQEHLSHGDHLGGCHVVASLEASNKTRAGVSNDHVKLYPNPVQDKLNIQLAADVIDQLHRISITDMSGKTLLLHQVKGQADVVIPIERLKPGFYLVKIFGNKVVTFKIVKQ